MPSCLGGCGRRRRVEREGTAGGRRSAGARTQQSREAVTTRAGLTRRILAEPLVYTSTRRRQLGSALRLSMRCMSGSPLAATTLAHPPRSRARQAVSHGLERSCLIEARGGGSGVCCLDRSWARLARGLAPASAPATMISGRGLLPYGPPARVLIGLSPGLRVSLISDGRVMRAGQGRALSSPFLPHPLRCFLRPPCDLSLRHCIESFSTRPRLED